MAWLWLHTTRRTKYAFRTLTRLRLCIPVYVRAHRPNGGDAVDDAVASLRFPLVEEGAATQPRKRKSDEPYQVEDNTLNRQYKYKKLLGKPFSSILSLLSLYVTVVNAKVHVMLTYRLFHCPSHCPGVETRCANATAHQQRPPTRLRAHRHADLA